MKSFRKTATFRCMTVIISALLVVATLNMSGCAFRSLLPSPDKPSDTGPTVIPDHTDMNSPQDGEGKDTEEAPTLPSYYDPLTGLGSEIDLSAARPVSFCFGTGSSTFGISDAKILIEAPVVGGGTRLAAITNTYSSLSQVGGIQTTRPYLSSLISLFSAVPVHAGNVGHHHALPSIDYTDNTMGTVFYRNPTAENGIFTSGTRLIGAMESFEKCSGTLPFSLVPYGETVTPNGMGATSVILPFSEEQITQFTYDGTRGEYLRRQNSAPHVDEGNSEQLAFTNLLLLVCESSIYNKANGTEMDLNIAGGGSGYYITGGRAARISWSRTDEGKFLLLDESGNELACNRGKTYIGMIDITKASTVMIVN